MPTTPNRSTSEAQLNQWNQQLRASSLWQNWMRSMGKDRPGAGLNERERGEFERYLAQNGVKIPGGMHIDQGGNLNQDNRLWRNVGIGAAIGGGALTGFGLAGMGPLAGALGGAGAAGGGAMPAAMGFETAGLAGPGAAGMLGGASAGGIGAASAAMPAAWGFETAAMPAGVGALKGVGLTPRMNAENAAAAGRGLPRSITDYLGEKPGKWGGVARDVVGGANKLSPLLQAAIAGLSGLPALMANNGPSAEEKALLDQARQMQALQQRRIEHQNPLYEAVTQLAMSRLPGASQQQLKPLQG